MVLDKKGKEAPPPFFGMEMGEHSPGFCLGAGRDRERGLS